jgi:hypothetical protein
MNLFIALLFATGLLLSLVVTGHAWTKPRDGKQGCIVSPFYFYAAAAVLFYITH